MKYYVVDKQNELVLFKVPNELIEEFENKHKGQVKASGNSIMEVLLEFEQVDDPRKGGEMESRPVKYRGDVQNI